MASKQRMLSCDFNLGRLALRAEQGQDNGLLEDQAISTAVAYTKNEQLSPDQLRDSPYATRETLQEPPITHSSHDEGTTASFRSPTRFVPRQRYPIQSLGTLPRTYYLGHHASAITKMKSMLSNIDLVIECRDYRIPVTSANPRLSHILLSPSPSGERRRRIVVYTKRDLGVGSQPQDVVEEKERMLTRQHRADGDDGVLFTTFTGTGTERCAKQLLQKIKMIARERWRLTSMSVLVVGMPNVGKSTLLNALRSVSQTRHEASGRVKTNKVAKVGGEPGVTRSVGGAIKILEGWEIDGDVGGREGGSDAASIVAADRTTGWKGARRGGGMGTGRDVGKAPRAQTAASEPVYLLDTPGVFMPYVPTASAMLKLALCGTVKEGLIPAVTLADYLLYRVNLVDPRCYRPLLPTDSWDGASLEPGLLAHHSPLSTEDEENTAEEHHAPEDGRPDVPNDKTKAHDPAAKHTSDDAATPKTIYGPTNSTTILLTGIARRTGRLLKAGDPDIEGAAAWLIKRWRAGAVGRFVLDELRHRHSADEHVLHYPPSRQEAERAALKVALEEGEVEEGSEGISVSQAFKRRREARRRESAAKFGRRQAAGL